MRATFAIVRIVAFTVLFVASSFAGARSPAPLPPLDGARSNISLQVVRYTGGVNGEMVVEIQNRGTRAEVFAAQGLYFVPDGDPDKAPQRLGAAGPFVIEGKGPAKPQEKLTLAPRARVQVRLQVFCIDSHRSSPTAENSFHLGKQRLPRELRLEIDGKAKAALGRTGGRMAPAKAAIQSDIWQARDRKWIRLDGERANEKAPRDGHRQAPRRHPLPIQRQQIE